MLCPCSYYGSVRPASFPPVKRFVCCFFVWLTQLRLRVSPLSYCRPPTSMNSSCSRRGSRSSSVRRDSASTGTTRRKSLTAKLSEKLSEAAFFLSSRAGGERMNRSASVSSLSSSRRHTAVEPEATASRVARDSTGSALHQLAPLGSSSGDSFSSSGSATSSHCGYRQTSAAQQPLPVDISSQPVTLPCAIAAGMRSRDDPLWEHPIYHRLRDINRCVRMPLSLLCRRTDRMYKPWAAIVSGVIAIVSTITSTRAGACAWSAPI